MSSKVDYSMGESIYMPPSDMYFNIKSGTVGYDNKILMSNGMFSLGRNNMVNTSMPIVHAPKKSSHMAPSVHMPSLFKLQLIRTKKKICFALVSTWYAF